MPRDRPAKTRDCRRTAAILSRPTRALREPKRAGKRHLRLYSRAAGESPRETRFAGSHIGDLPAVCRRAATFLGKSQHAALAERSGRGFAPRPRIGSAAGDLPRTATNAARPRSRRGSACASCRPNLLLRDRENVRAPHGFLGSEHLAPRPLGVSMFPYFRECGERAVRMPQAFGILKAFPAKSRTRASARWTRARLLSLRQAALPRKSRHAAGENFPVTICSPLKPFSARYSALGQVSHCAQSSQEAGRHCSSSSPSMWFF